MGEKRNAYIPSRPDEYYGRLGQWISWVSSTISFGVFQCLFFLVTYLTWCLDRNISSVCLVKRVEIFSFDGLTATMIPCERVVIKMLFHDFCANFHSNKARLNLNVASSSCGLPVM